MTIIVIIYEWEQLSFLRYLHFIDVHDESENLFKLVGSSQDEFFKNVANTTQDLQKFFSTVQVSYGFINKGTINFRFPFIYNLTPRLTRVPSRDVAILTAFLAHSRYSEIIMKFKILERLSLKYGFPYLKTNE